MAEGIADVDQAIRILLGTPRGSDPHRPEFGSDLHRYLDWPVQRALPHLIRETVTAIRRWEPRCQLLRVTHAAEGARVVLTVVWKAVDGLEQRTEFRP
ncbi:GPW/gp25 family protein [Lysobacter sp. CA196]|uniref:GPW/gp25 family protein n=1 Tax=Lysobacter sp. CA196 TaxID=3455606 RepID=UPI003F8CF579